MRVYSAADVYRKQGDGVALIPPHIREDLVRIADRCNVESLILFGSRAKGTAVSASDIDLAVAGGDFDAFAAAADTEVRTLLMLDLTNLDDTTAEPFAAEIQRTGVLIYNRRFYVKKLDNFQGCLEVLRNADFSLSSEDPIYRIGILAQFRMSFELGWKALQQIMRDDGVGGSEQGSPREILQLGLAVGYLPDESVWFEMLRWRNVSTHVYDELKADALIRLIERDFLPALDRLSQTLGQKVCEARAVRYGDPEAAGID